MTATTAPRTAAIAPPAAAAPEVPRVDDDVTVTPVTCATHYSIGRRLSRSIALQTVICLSIVAAMFYAATTMLFEQKHRETAVTLSTVVGEIARRSAAAGADEATVVQKLASYADRRPGTWVLLRRPDGTTFYSDPPASFDTGARESLRLDFGVDVPELGTRSLVGTLWLDCTADRRTLAHLMGWLVATVIAGGLFAWAGAYWQVRRGLAPLRDIAAQTRAIDADRLGQRLALAEPVEELQPSIDQFNALMSRLERAYTQLDAFNADVAHELRTPLATLIGQAELALSRDRTCEDLRETLGSGLEELQRLSAMINDMLFLASADRGAVARRGDPVSLAALARDVAEFHEAALEDRALTLRVEGDACLPVDAPLVKRAVSNLVANATRYAAPGSTIAVRIDTTGTRDVRVLVENAGPAIEPRHLPRLFDRFFRVDASRQCPQGDPCEAPVRHHGLGLAIVAAIARMHGGQTRAESGGGLTRIGFTLAASPAAPVPAA